MQPLRRPTDPSWRRKNTAPTGRARVPRPLGPKSPAADVLGDRRALHGNQRGNHVVM